MKYLSFRTFLICILMPTALYLLIMQGIETYFQKKWNTELQQVLIIDPKPILEGRIDLAAEIKRKIDAYLTSNYSKKFGISAEVTVKTKTGRLIYPYAEFTQSNFFGTDTIPHERFPDTSAEMLRVATNNWKIMQEGIQLFLDVKIDRNSWLANGILTFCIMLFAYLPYRAYQIKSKEVRQIEISKQQALEAVDQKLTDAQQSLRKVTDRALQQQQEINRLRTDLDLADSRVRMTEDEALAEIEKLDRNLTENIELKENLELEVLRLQEELDKLEASHHLPPEKRTKQEKIAEKRFKTLYKNLEIHPRAIEGFIGLESHMQLQAEELIHTINEDSGDIPVKRKVFSNKGSVPILECEFGRKGRLYWKSGPGKKRQIFVIGTKNSQSKDLAFLEKL